MSTMSMSDKSTSKGRATPPWSEVLISFTPYDAVGVQFLHTNVLVISAIIADYKVKKVLVDMGSSADVLFMHSFDQLHI